MKKFNQNQGFTLIEVMISIAIMTVAMLGFAQYMNYQNQQTKQIEVKNNMNQVNSTIQQSVSQSTVIINSEAACNSADQSTCD